MKSIEYKPEEAFPVIFHCFGPSPPSMTVGGAQQLYGKLGEVLKKVPPEKHEDIRFGPVKDDKEKK